jgi:hypothetical protein
MTRSEKLRDLAARVEALTAPDFALGVEVLRAVGRDIGDVNPLFSLDAAASLVPEGCLWSVRTLWDGAKTAAQCFISMYRHEPPALKFWKDDAHALAATPALALTAAALRALAEEAGDE